MLLVLMGMYAFANIAASVITCRSPKLWKYLCIMPVVFAAYHFGYGWGFLLGSVDFVLLKRRGRDAHARITR
jgi:ABC-type Fe3+ transport system permease subunit